MPAMKPLLTALLAAIVSFVWGYVSWMQLGWHDAGTRDFKDEAAVAEVIKDNATNGRGIYMLPYERGQRAARVQEARAIREVGVGEQHLADRHAVGAGRALPALHEQALADGPYIYAIVRPGRQDGSMGESLIRSFIRSLIASLIVGSLMNLLVISYAGRVSFAGALGAFAGLAVDMQQWIWFELPTRDLIVNMADHFIEWTLAGAVLGLFLGKDPTVRDVH